MGVSDARACSGVLVRFLKPGGSYNAFISNLSITQEAAMIIGSDFEINPFDSGWTTGGPGASWTDAQAKSGKYSLYAQNDFWASPLLDTTLNQW